MITKSAIVNRVLSTLNTAAGGKVRQYSQQQIKNNTVTGLKKYLPSNAASNKAVKGKFSDTRVDEVLKRSRAIKDAPKREAFIDKAMGKGTGKEYMKLDSERSKAKVKRNIGLVAAGSAGLYGHKKLKEREESLHTRGYY